VDYYLWITLGLMFPSARNIIPADNPKPNPNKTPVKAEHISMPYGKKK
jgi:hypothetical protein